MEETTTPATPATDAPATDAPATDAPATTPVEPETEGKDEATESKEETAA